MSKVEKVQIRGIRSFDPNVPETLQFNTPLTLIVGYNGSGKTTVIESLKYATTGEQPPNSKGGAFVHDPKLLGDREVYAQVKLSFKSIIGEELVVTRNLQVTQKKTTKTMTMKTLDGSLFVRNGADKHVLSSKVAELDEMVPHKLGVPPAILENVIFCHQDESLWPMSEPSVLKKKFDEIFEALKYTKAIDNLKQVRKKQQEDLGKSKILEGVHRDAKEKGERVHNLIKTLMAKIEELRVNADELTEQMGEADKQLKETSTQAQSFLGVVQNLSTKRQQYDYKQENAVELQRGLDEMAESDKRLEDSLAQYEQQIQLLRDDVQQKSAQSRQLQADLTSSRNSLGAKHAEQGRLQSDKDKYERQLESRVTMIHEAAERHEIRGYDGDLNDAHARAFRTRIEKMLMEKRRELERVIRDNGKELDKASGVINELETKKSSRIQDRVSAKQRMDAIEKRSGILQNDIRNLDVDEGSLAVLQSSLDELNARFQKATDALNNSTFDSQLQQENSRLSQLETEAEKLTRELVDCTKFAADRAQLDLRKKELAERQRKYNTLKGTWNEKLGAIVGAAWQVESLEPDFHKVLQQQKTVVAEARKRVEATQQEVRLAEHNLSTMRERQQTLKADSARCQTAVLTTLKKVAQEAKSDAEDPDAMQTDKSLAPPTMDDFETEIESHEEDLAAVDRDINLFDHFKIFYTKAQTTLEQNKCHLCDREFVDQPREKSKLMVKIAKNLSDNEKEELQKERVGVDNRLGRLRALRPQHDTYRRAETELPVLGAQIKEAEACRDALVRQLEAQDVTFKQSDEKRQDTEAMNKTVMGILQAFRDMSDSEKQINRLSSQQQSSGPARSVEDIEELRAQGEVQLKTIRIKISKLTADRQRMKESAGALELEKSELNNKLAHAVRQSERKSDLLGQVQSLKDESGNQREAIQQTDGDLEKLEPEIANARSVREDTRQRCQAKEQKVAVERDSVAQTVSELKMVESDIVDYNERGGPANLAANLRSIQALEQTISRTEQEASNLTGQIDKARAEVDNSGRHQKNIQDNLNYRKTLRDLETLKQEIDELESRNATEDYDRLSALARSLEDQRGKFLAERSTIWGVMRSKDEELLRLIEEYDQDYKNAEFMYRESLIKVKTTAAAIDDLGRYQGALDKAIMQYHSLKMAEVNRITGELWQSTYQGTDIDTILIRSDTESASKERRTYNYRVSMVKQDTEMDMRGRCSAGQKVLASIIIRLALAESFGVNCGLIALDEPTTNLDTDNIKSLARSLHNIIQARQAQANFQLIVITHDEEFLRSMQCSDFCDTFYRIKRDEQQNSVIEKQSITKLIEG